MTPDEQREYEHICENPELAKALAARGEFDMADPDGSFRRRREIASRGDAAYQEAFATAKAELAEAEAALVPLQKAHADVEAERDRRRAELVQAAAARKALDAYENVDLGLSIKAIAELSDERIWVLQTHARIAARARDEARRDADDAEIRVNDAREHMRHPEVFARELAGRRAALQKAERPILMWRDSDRDLLADLLLAHGREGVAKLRSALGVPKLTARGLFCLAGLAETAGEPFSVDAGIAPNTAHEDHGFQRDLSKQLKLMINSVFDLQSERGRQHRRDLPPGSQAPTPRGVRHLRRGGHDVDDPSFDGPEAA